jgi:hypothetical protein
MKILLEKVNYIPEAMQDELQCCIEEYNSPENVASMIMSKLTVSEVEKAIVVLLENLKSKS